LLEPQTKEVSLVTSIYAPKQKISPKRAMIIVGGLIAGLIIGMLLMMIKRTHNAYKVSNQ
jgi:uncharacterized protein involved in exopolysaccharide biosynthesis